MLTSSLKVKGGFSELYFMDKNHTQRFYITSSENHNDIKTLADELSNELKIPIESYKPRTY